MKDIKNIVIIGATGLMGGSLALALKNVNPNYNITGICRNHKGIQRAVKFKIYDYLTININKQVFNNIDLVVLCTPVSYIPVYVNDIAGFLKDDAVITDVGSIKSNIYDKIKPEYKNMFVGSHPMTGSEKTGIENSDKTLYENSIVIITPDKNTDKTKLKMIKSFWKQLNCIIKTVDYNTHDKIVAYISHLPHLAASGLVNTANNFSDYNESYISFAGGGFRDTTRIASSDSGLWTDICKNNKKFIIESINSFINNLEKVKSFIEKNEFKKLTEFLDKAAVIRENIPKHLKDSLQISYELIVKVPDVPGILGKITTLLGNSEISIKHIEVLHVREGRQGAVKLGFRNKKNLDKAIKTLQKNKYSVTWNSLYV